MNEFQLGKSCLLRVTGYSIVMRIIYGLLSLLLVYGAYLQLNDPDPIFWVPLYLIPAVLVALPVLGRTGRWMYIPAVAYILFGLSYAPRFKGVFDDVVVQMTDHSEFTREGLGLIFMGLLVVIAARWGKKTSVQETA